MTIKTNLLTILTLTASPAVYCAHMSNHASQQSYDAELKRALAQSREDDEMQRALVASQQETDLQRALAASMQEQQPASAGPCASNSPKESDQKSRSALQRTSELQERFIQESSTLWERNVYDAQYMRNLFKNYFKEGVTINGCSKHHPHRTALLAACSGLSTADYSTLKILLDFKANVNSQDFFGMTPLMLVVENCIPMTSGKTRALISANPDITLTNKKNETVYDIGKRVKHFPAQSALDDYRRTLRDKNNDARVYVESSLLSLCQQNAQVIPIILSYYTAPYPLCLEHPLPEDAPQRQESKRN